MVTVRLDHNTWQENAGVLHGNLRHQVKPQVSAPHSLSGRRVDTSNWSNLVPHSGHIRHNEPVSTGKRAGSRRGARPPRTLNKTALALGAAITLCIVAWGYLVYAAIDFGTAAREGSSSAWTFMALACLGAIACLFVGLLLVSRLMRALGITSPPSSDSASSPTPSGPRPVGGKRAAR